MKTRLTSISFLLAMAAAVFLLVWPVYSGFGSEGVTHATLVQVNGEWAIIAVMFPVLVAFVPVLVPKQVVRIIAAFVMGGFALISGFSIGLFYLPAAVLMVLAACVEDSAKFRDLFW